MLTDESVTEDRKSSIFSKYIENITDNPQIAMILRRLPEDFKPFSTVATLRKEEWKFSEFKSALRTYKIMKNRNTR